MRKTDTTRLVALARRQGVITTGEVARAGIHSQHLTRLVAEGVLQRIARGHYRLASIRPTRLALSLDRSVIGR